MKRIVTCLLASVFLLTVSISPVSAAPPASPDKSVACVKSENRIARMVQRDAPAKKITVAVKRARKICGTGTKPVVTPTPSPTPTAAPEVTPDVAGLPVGWQENMLRQANTLRAGVGVAPLALCASINAAAQKYATLMADTGHYAHQGPDGRSPWDRMTAEGYNYQSAAENIAWGQDDVDEVMQDWIESPGHYKNLVNKSFDHVGFGGSASSDGEISWVQNFGAGGKC